MSKVFLILFSLFIFLENTWSATILIDPGHGGDDYGAKGHLKSGDVWEKDITLSFALELQNQLKKTHHVFLSRNRERTLNLGDRAKMAEVVNADLFISIHANWAGNQNSHGFEIYYPNNQANKAIQHLETLENNSKVGENIGGTVDQILTDLIVQRTAGPSQDLAKKIETRLTKNASLKINNRGIHPGLFYVLLLSKRPAILIELGFLSNSKELQKISSASLQRLYAKSLVQGIEDYLQDHPSQAQKTVSVY